MIRQILKLVIIYVMVLFISCSNTKKEGNPYLEYGIEGNPVIDKEKLNEVVKEFSDNYFTKEENKDKEKIMSEIEDKLNDEKNLLYNFSTNFNKVFTKEIIDNSFDKDSMYNNIIRSQSIDSEPIKKVCLYYNYNKNGMDNIIYSFIQINKYNFSIKDTIMDTLNMICGNG